MPKFNSDTEAICALIKGDMHGLEFIYNAYYATIRTFLKPYCKISADADELTQDTFLQLWDARAKVNPEQNIKSFLFTIAKNKALDEIRKYKRHEAKIDTLMLHKNESYSTIDDVIFADYQRVLSLNIAKLPKRNQEIFSLSRDACLTNREISVQLNISVKAVEKQISKTLASVRIFLKNHQISPVLFFLTFIFSNR